MKNRGFTLIEVIVCIFLLGIISLFSFSTISLSHRGFNRISIRNEMNYIGEMVIENLKTDDPYIKEALEELSQYGEFTYNDGNFDNSKYKVIVSNDYETESFMEIIVKVYYNYEEKEHIYVEFKATIPK